MKELQFSQPEYNIVRSSMNPVEIEYSIRVLFEAVRSHSLFFRLNAKERRELLQQLHRCQGVVSDAKDKRNFENEER